MSDRIRDCTVYVVKQMRLSSLSTDKHSPSILSIYSAIKKQSVQARLLILGDLSIQGNIKSLRSLVDPPQVGMDNGARRALIPLENKRNFLEVSGSSWSE